MSLAPANAPVQQAASNAKDDAHDIRYPVVYVCAAVEAGLDEFDGAAEGAGTDEDRQQPNAARAGQREGQRSEGDEVDEFIRSVGRGRRLVHGPEHRDGQCERQDKCQGDVEVLAHLRRCIWGPR